MIDTLDSARMIRCWFWRLGGLGGPVVEAVSACPCKFHRIDPLDHHEIGDFVLGAQKNQPVSRLRKERYRLFLPLVLGVNSAGDQRSTWRVL